LPRSVAIAAVDGSWFASPVIVAGSGRQRRLGVKAGAETVLLRTRAVHGRGLESGLRLVSVSSGGKVLATSDLQIGEFAWLPEATWVLEMPLDAPPPPIGMALAIYPQARARTTSLVCDPDR